MKVILHYTTLLFIRTSINPSKQQTNRLGMVGKITSNIERFQSNELLSPQKRSKSVWFSDHFRINMLVNSIQFAEPILVQCHISIPPENVRKPKVF